MNSGLMLSQHEVSHHIEKKTFIFYKEAIYNPGKPDKIRKLWGIIWDRLFSSKSQQLRLDTHDQITGTFFFCKS